MPCFFLYDLTVDSDLALPECLPCTTANAAVDVQIRCAPVAETGLGLEGPFLQISPQKVWHHVPGVARFLVESGCRITVDVAPGADHETLHLYLLGIVFGSLLLQRGSMVLHGNAIDIDGQCLVCVGDSGAGKSTLAAAFIKAGFHSLSDDVVLVAEDGSAVPAFPRLRLHGDALDGLQISRDGVAKIDFYPDKYAVPTAAQFCRQRLPVKWIVVLAGPGSGDALHWQPISGIQCLPVLKRYCFLPGIARRIGFSATHFYTGTRLAGAVTMWRVWRPAQGFSAERMRSEILAAIGRSQAPAQI